MLLAPWPVCDLLRSPLMSSTRLAIAAGAAALLLAFVPAAEAKKAMLPKCTARAATLKVSTTQIRVFKYHSKLYSCWRPTRRVTLLYPTASSKHGLLSDGGPAGDRRPLRRVRHVAALRSRRPVRPGLLGERPLRALRSPRGSAPGQRRQHGHLHVRDGRPRLARFHPDAGLRRGRALPQGRQDQRGGDRSRPRRDAHARLRDRRRAGGPGDREPDARSGTSSPGSIAGRPPRPR